MEYQEVKSGEVCYYVKKPGMKDYRDAQAIYNKAFRKALESGAILKQKLNDYIIEQGLWDDKKEVKYKSLIEKIRDLEGVIAGGGISLKNAKTAAIDLRRARNELQELISERNMHETNCVEGQADNEKFNHLVISCTLKADKNTRVWNSIEEYDEQATEPWAVECATKLATMLYGLDPNYEKNLPENKFLVDYKFTDSEFNLVNKEGHIVDLDGRLIDKEGYYIKYVDGAPVRITKDGKELDSDGKVKIEFKPFLDDESGEEVVADTESPSPTESA